MIRFARQYVSEMSSYFEKLGQGQALSHNQKQRILKLWIQLDLMVTQAVCLSSSHPSFVVCSVYNDNFDVQPCKQGRRFDKLQVCSAMISRMFGA